MLDKLIGAQIKRIKWDLIEIELNGKTYTLNSEEDNGDCCGFAKVNTIVHYEEGSKRNPIITNIEYEDTEDEYFEKYSMRITFYGESAPLVSIESEAGSGSGWQYGACVTLVCKALDIEEVMARW